MKAAIKGRKMMIVMMLMLLSIKSTYPVEYILMGVFPCVLLNMSLNPLVYLRGNNAETKGLFSSSKKRPKNETCKTAIISKTTSFDEYNPSKNTVSANPTKAYVAYRRYFDDLYYYSVYMFAARLFVGITV